MPDGGEWVNMEIDRQKTGQSIWNLVQIFTLMAINHCFVCHSIATRFGMIQKKSKRMKQSIVSFFTVATNPHRSPLIQLKIYTRSEKKQLLYVVGKKCTKCDTFVHKIKWKMQIVKGQRERKTFLATVSPSHVQMVAEKNNVKRESKTDLGRNANMQTEKRKKRSKVKFIRWARVFSDARNRLTRKQMLLTRNRKVMAVALMLFIFLSFSHSFFYDQSIV